VGWTGLFLAALPPNDVHLNQTYFVMRRTSTMSAVGGATLALFKGIHYWWVSMTGRMYPKAGRGWRQV